MSELLGVADSFGFECLGDIGPAPPEARLSYYVEYGHDPREPERRFFIASSASLPKLPKPAPRRQRKPHIAPPGGLLTSAQAAAKLGCSIKTLNGHVAAGDLRYVIIGKGTKRPRKMFTDADLDAFITNQTRKDVPCPSTRTATVARRTSTSTSKCEVIGFTARRNARRNVKPKK